MNIAPPAPTPGGAGKDILPRDGAPPRLRSGAGRAFAVLLLLLFASLIVAAGVGSERLSPSQVWTALRHGPGSYITQGSDAILWQTHLPVALMAALTGASLAAAGVAFQALLRNDLADPYIVGVSAGASVGTEAVLIKGGEAWLGGLSVPLAAFGAATAAMMAVYTLARRGGRVHLTSLLLAGVVISSLLGGASTIMLLLGPAQDAQHIMGRLMGSFADAWVPISERLTPEAWQPFQQDAVLLLFLLAGLLAMMLEARAMNLFALGEESAQQLGVETERFKVTLIVTGSLLTAATVAFAGIIGFVGLMSPHIARRLARTPDHRVVLPLAALAGAVLMVWADLIARSLLSDGRPLPVGAVTAFLGTPFFLSLLRRQGR